MSDIDIRKRLIDQAIHKPVRTFLQIDLCGITEPYGRDGLCPADENGHLITYGVVNELRRFDIPLRIQIHEDADPDEIRKAVAALPEYLDDALDYMRAELMKRLEADS